MSKVDRRNFLKNSLAAAAAGTAFLQGAKSIAAASAPVSTKSKPMGANGDIRVAVIGFNRQGRSHINGYREMKGVRVVALCDADADVLEREKKKNFTDKGLTVDTYQDLRKVLERDDIDAISTATPNHWHSLLTVWACQAGKDVYVEKPVSHNVWEGRKAFEAARKYNRIVQAGTQSRSNTGIAETIKALQGGELGKILLCRGLCYKVRDSIGQVPGAQVVPESVDYDLWTGPAEMQPLMRKELHYDWHWVFNTGNGDIGNQGIHEMDVARWACGAPSVSSRVLGIGGRFGYEDDADTPNTEIVYHDFGPDYPPIIFEVRGLPRSPELAGDRDIYGRTGVSVGDIIHCEGGYWAGGWLYDNDHKRIRQIKGEGAANHKQNFIDCVRSRKREDLKVDIFEGHLSSALCHTGNISYCLGQKMAPEQIKERFDSKPYLEETFEKMREHLAIHNVDITKDLVTIGPWLEMDPETERFTGPSEWTLVANSMLSRNYRAPFVVPEKV